MALSPFQIDFDSINSADALDVLARSLDDLSDKMKARAQHLRYVRKNYAPIDDKKAVVNAALMAVRAVKTGSCPASACRAAARAFSLPLSAVELVYKSKSRALDRERRAERDRRIVQDVRSGSMPDNVARRYGLSRGRVVQIVSEYDARAAARAAGLSLPAWRRLNGVS